MALVAPQIQYASLALQGAAGQSTVVAAAGAGLRIYVVAYGVTLDANGTLKFQSNSTDLTGAMTVTTTSPAANASDLPLFATAANEALKITSATGKAAGYVAYIVGQ